MKLQRERIPLHALGAYPCDKLLCSYHIYVGAVSRWEAWVGSKPRRLILAAESPVNIHHFDGQDVGWGEGELLPIILIILFFRTSTRKTKWIFKTQLCRGAKSSVFLFTGTRVYAQYWDTWFKDIVVLKALFFFKKKKFKDLFEKQQRKIASNRWFTPQMTTKLELSRAEARSQKLSGSPTWVSGTQVREP